MPSKTKPRLPTKTATLSAPRAKANGHADTKALESVGSMGQRVDEALKTSEVRYRRLFETAKDGILLLDADTGRITDSNPFLEDMLGYSHTEFIGKALWEIGPVKDIQASQEAMRHLQSQDYIRYENLPLETKAGETRQVEFVSNIYWVNGTRVIQCNIRDITARKRAEAEVHTVTGKLVTLVAKLQQRDQEMQSLNRMNDLLQSCTTRTEAYQVIGLLAGELFAGQHGGLAIMSAGNSYLETVARWGPVVMLESSFAGPDCWAMRRGQLHEVTNPQLGLLCRHFVHPPSTGYLCVPLTVQGETLGVLCLVGVAGSSGEPSTRHSQLAVTVGESIKLSLSNLKLREELREQATHDPLTGLYNRRYLEESLARELSRAERRKAPLCIAMLDLDNFKDFNDSFGHGAGDSLLCAFGRILHAKLRKSDIACRYGGEEFVLILPDSSLADTRQRVEQIRTLVNELQLRHGEQLSGPMTVSAGIAEVRAHGETADELLQAADEALYAAKRAGRDRISIFTR